MDKFLSRVNVIRLISLLIGILLWVIVHMDENATESGTRMADLVNDNWIYDVSVRYTGLDEDRFRLVSMEPRNVDIMVRGRTVDLLKVSTRGNQSQIVADLSHVTAGTHTVALRPVGFPQGVEVVTIQPNQVTVVIEEIQRKEVPVEVEIRGEPDEKFRVGEPIANPNRAHVTASQSVLQDIVAVKAVVNVAGAKETVQGEYRLVAVDENGNEVPDAAIEPKTAYVEVPVTLPFRTIPLNLNLSGQPADGYSVASIRQSVEEVTVYGSEEALRNFEIYDGIRIDLTGLASTQKRQYDIPRKEGIEQVVPETVEIEVVVVPSETKSFPGVEIALNGVHDDYVVTILQPEGGRFDLTVIGAPERLAALERDQIEAVVDVSNLPPGVHVRPLKINLPYLLRPSADTPATVQVEVVKLSNGQSTRQE